MSSCITFQHWHDAGEACDNFNITQEPKNIFHSFDGMEIIIHFDNQGYVLYNDYFSRRKHKNPPCFYIAKQIVHFCFE